MRIPLFFIMFLIFLFVCNNIRRKIQQKERKSIDDFWKQETTANCTYPQDISKLNYVDFTKVSLPFSCFDDSILHQCEQQVHSFSQQKVLNLTGISNTTLKEIYGAANLGRLSRYDENFTVLVRTLNQWGHRLNQLSCLREAQSVLEFAVSIGSDIKPTYALLGEIYQSQGNIDGIAMLKITASSLNSLMKEPILKLLNETA